jgi:hypothetical protein
MIPIWNLEEIHGASCIFRRTTKNQVGSFLTLLVYSTVRLIIKAAAAFTHIQIN